LEEIDNWLDEQEEETSRRSRREDLKRL